MAMNREGVARATRIVAGILLPLGALVAVGLVRYVAVREAELARRNQRTLAGVARQIATRLEAGRRAWAAACPDPVDLEKVELPGLRIKSVVPPKQETKRYDACGTPPRPARIRVRNGQIVIAATGCLGTIPLEGFVQEVVSIPKTFDALLLVDAKGGEVFSHVGTLRTSVVHVRDLARAPTDARKDAERLEPPVALAATQRVLLGGDRFSLQAERVGVFGSTDLVLAGLVREDRLDSERWVLPYWWVLGFALVLVLSALSWPILKLWFMGRGERLTTVDARVLVVTSVLATAVMSIAVIAALTTWAAGRVLDAHMRALATTVESRLQTEIEVARQQVIRSQDVLGPTLSQLQSSQASKECPAVPDTIDGKAASSGPAVLIDPRGNARCRWEPDPTRDYTLALWTGPTPCLGDRQYFRDARADNLSWTGSGHSIRRYAVELVRSKLTGTDLLGVAAPVSWTDAASPGAERADFVLVVSRRPAAFRWPILPTGFSFALVDAQGQVQLHADPGRNLDENLLDEVDDRAEIEAVIKARGTRFLGLHYSGGSYRAFVRPLAFGPWTIVVFRDEQPFQSLLTEVIARWAFVFALYLIPYVLALILLQIVNDRYQAPWLWPSRNDVGTVGYFAAAGVLVVVSMVTTTLFGRVAGGWRALVLCPVPALALLAVWGTLRVVRRLQAGVTPATSAAGERRFRLSYVAMTWTMLVAMSGAPSALVWTDVTEATLAEIDVTLDRRVALDANGRRAEMRDTCAQRPSQCPSASVDSVGRATFDWPKPFSAADPTPPRLATWLHDRFPTYSATGAWLRSASGDVVRPVATQLFGSGTESRGLVLVPTPAMARVVVFGCFVLMSLVSGGVVWSVVVRLYLLDADRPDVLDVTTSAARTVVVWIYGLGLPAVGLGQVAPTPADSLDLRWTSATDVAQWFKDHRAAAWWYVFGLEARLGDASFEKVLLEGIEGRIARAANLVVASSVDPMRHLETLACERVDHDIAAPAPAAEAPTATASATSAVDDTGLARWARVLSRLDGQRLDVANPPSNALETSLEAVYKPVWPTTDVPAETNDQASAAWYRCLWEQSSRRERLAMRQLAEESYLGPSDVETARALFRRRLIERDGSIVFMTRSFRRFVLRADSDVQIAKWEHDLGAGTWARLNAPLQASLAIAGAVLLWTQEELRTTAVAVPAAITSALPLLVQILGKLGSDGNAARSGKNARRGI